MNKISVLVFFCLFNLGYSQEIKDIDKLTIDICNSMINSKEENDSLRVQKSFEEQIIPFMEKFKLVELNEEIINKIDYRIQKNCDWYQKFLSKKFEYNEKSDWKILDEKPISTINSKDCVDFFKKHSKFYYFESEGEKTFVEISNNFWIDQFTDGTFSKLGFKLNNCHFELKFIESNNLGRSNFSTKDDVYYYDILSVEKNILTIIAYQKNPSTYYQFKLYAVE